MFQLNYALNAILATVHSIEWSQMRRICCAVDNKYLHIDTFVYSIPIPRISIFLGRILCRMLRTKQKHQASDPLLPNRYEQCFVLHSNPLLCTVLLITGVNLKKNKNKCLLFIKKIKWIFYVFIVLGAIEFFLKLQCQ